MLLFGLVMSALSSVLMGVVNELTLFYLLALIVGILADLGGPAQSALVADLLPEEQRAGGFGIMRVVANLAVTIGPVIGGFLAARSYLSLFITDAVSSIITAVILFFTLVETRKPKEGDESEETITETFGGYFDVMRDVVLVWFLFASILMVLVYMQMNTTLAVYLRDAHGITPQGYGYILSLNAGMVVLLQFPITRWVNKYRPLLVMAVGTLLYAVGFAMYGFVSAFFMFLIAMVIITVGEMFVSPVSQSIVARLAPEDMRGRYMAVYGFSWLIPVAIGPLLAGLVMDNFDPNWVWYLAGIIGLVAAVAYYWLEVRVGRARTAVIYERLGVLEQLEEGKIDAVKAGHLLEHLQENSWARLAAKEEAIVTPTLRIQVSDQETGLMKRDLRIPVGLVSTVLHTEGTLSSDLAAQDRAEIKELIAQGMEGSASRRLESGEDQIEVSLE
jgi:MFS family permease